MIHAQTSARNFGRYRNATHRAAPRAEPSAGRKHRLHTAGWLTLLAAVFFCIGHVPATAAHAASATAPAFVIVPPPTPSVAEARKIVVDYMLRMASQRWICQSTMDYTKEKPYTKTLVYQPGVAYVGLPYVSHHNGVEAFSRYLDAKQVYTGPVSFAKCLGVTCAPAVKVAYRTVSPTVSFGGTPNILPHARTGTVAVGDYHWDVSTPANATLTKDLIEKSTPNVILEAYALLQPADTVASRTSAGPSQIFGHARLVSSQPVVVRTAGGKIDPDASSLHVIEQCGSFDKTAQVNTTWRVNKKYTFAELLKKNYVPLTLEEFKTGRMADAQVDVNGLTGPESIASDRPLAGVVTSNFVINEVDAIVSGPDGRVASQARYFPEKKRCELGGEPFDHDLTKLPAGTYRFVLTVKIGYGDCTGAEYTFQKR